MKKKSFNSMARKILCLALSASMITGNLAWNVSAADAEDVQDQTSQLQLNCETKALELLDNGRSIAAKVCLTQPDSLIGQNIFTEDITLGGVFRNMVVHDVQNDHDTILLDLVGVPDFSENDVQGTMKFPGFLFDGDDSVTASIDVIKKEGEEVTTKPYFHPYLDGLRENGDNIEMVIVLMPLVGKFTDGFSAKDIAFYQDLYGAKIKNARKTEDGCYEIMVSAPKVEIEGHSCYGGIVLREGSMTGPEGTAYEKPVYAVREYSLNSVGRDLTEKDINSIKHIVGGFGNTTAGTIFGVLGGAGTAYTIGSTVLGLVGVLPTDSSRHKDIMEKLQAIQNELHNVSEKCDYMVGALDAHTRMLINMTLGNDEKYLGDFDSQFDSMVTAMNKLEQDIQNPLVQEEIEEVLLRLCEKYQVPQSTIGRDIDEDLLLDDAEYLENEVDISVEDFDFYEEEYDNFDIGGDGEETMDLETLFTTEELFEDENGFDVSPNEFDFEDWFGEEDPGAFTGEVEEAEELTEEDVEQVEEQAEEDAALAKEQAVGDAEQAEEQADEDAEQAEVQAVEDSEQAEEQADEDAEQVEVQAVEDSEQAKEQADEDAEQEEEAEEEQEMEEELADSDITESVLSSEEEILDEALEAETQTDTVKETETEEVIYRELDRSEAERFLKELNREIGKIYLTSNITIGKRVETILNYYETLYPKFKKNDSSNPIVTFCDVHRATDNFATTSLNEKETYKEYIKYQFSRALNILVALDSPTSYTEDLNALNERNEINEKTKRDGWVQVDKVGENATDEAGNPFCYLMQDYVRLATPAESEALLRVLRWHDGSKNVVAITSKEGLNVSMDDFVKRMNGRTLNQELELAGIRNLGEIKGDPYTYTTKDYWNHNINPFGIAFRFERWGHESESYKTLQKSPPLGGSREVDMWIREEVAREFTFYRTKDFAYVCPAFLRWGDRRKNMICTGYWYSSDVEGNVYVDGAVHKRYSYDDQQWYYEMPMTYFVRLSR